MRILSNPEVKKYNLNLFLMFIASIIIMLFVNIMSLNIIKDNIVINNQSIVGNILSKHPELENEIVDIITQSNTNQNVELGKEVLEKYNYKSSITLKEEPINNDQIEILQKTKNWLDRYFKGEKPDIKELSLKPQGSLFRQEVWKLLCEIPYGEVTTYGKIAKVVAQKLHKEKMSGQAVGNAVGHNPISIIIPCHRVVGTSGSLTGYAGGIDKKIALLKHEGVDMTHYFIPKNR